MLCSSDTSGEESPQRQVLTYLRRKRLLIVLDNLEDFIATPEVAWLVDLLHAAAGVKLLATSQVRLSLPGEQVFPLGGLELPLEGEEPIEQAAVYGSLELFRQAARRSHPGFQLATENFAAVEKICRLVEGSPLGIELAAGWVSVLSPAEIQSEIETSLDFLETMQQAVPDRQRSLRAVFNASWKMLDETERAAAQRLAAFQGGFDVPAARQIAGLAPQALMNLVNKSWIQRERHGRFRFYSPLKVYVTEIAAQEDGWEAVCQDHSAYFCDLARRLGARLHTTDFAAAREQMHHEQNNFGAAWGWAIRRRRWDLIAQALPGLGAYHQLFSPFSEGEALVAEAAAAILDAGEPVSGCLPAHLLGWQAAFTRDPQAAARLLARAQMLLDRSFNRDQPDCRRIQALIWHQAGQNVAWQDRPQAIALFEQSLEAYQALGDEQAAAEVMVALGWATWVTLKVEAAEAWLEQALAIQKRIGDIFFVAKCLTLLGMVMNYRGRFKQAQQFHEESLAHYRALEAHLGIADILFVLAYTYARNGEWKKAEEHARESLTEFARVGYDGPFLSKAYRSLGYVLVARGEYALALSIVQKGLAKAQQYNNLQEVGFSHLLLGRLDLLEVDLSRPSGIFRKVSSSSLNYGTGQGCSPWLTSQLPR